MNKILILVLLAISLNGCRYIKTKDAYIDAQESPELKIPEANTAPNASASLEVPDVEHKKEIIEVPSNSPPDMPIRTKQNEKASVRIENRDGFPVLIVKNNKEVVWSAIQALELENWSQKSSNEESCESVLKYNDVAAREREESGFLRKLFRRDGYYVDYTGLFRLNCKARGSITEVQFAKQDGTQAKTFLADSVMNALFEALDDTKE